MKAFLFLILTKPDDIYFGGAVFNLSTSPTLVL